MGYMVIFTDGYEISTERHQTLEKAQEYMRKEYEKYRPAELSEEWANISYLTDMDAILYNNGEDVFLWKIIKI